MFSARVVAVASDEITGASSSISLISRVTVFSLLALPAKSVAITSNVYCDLASKSAAEFSVTAPVFSSILKAPASAPARLNLTPSLTSLVSSAIAVYTNWPSSPFSSIATALAEEITSGAVSSTLFTVSVICLTEPNLESKLFFVAKSWSLVTNIIKLWVSLSSKSRVLFNVISPSVLIDKLRSSVINESTAFPLLSKKP